MSIHCTWTGPSTGVTWGKPWLWDHCSFYLLQWERPLLHLQWGAPQQELDTSSWSCSSTEDAMGAPASGAVVFSLLTNTNPCLEKVAGGWTRSSLEVSIWASRSGAQRLPRSPRGHQCFEEPRTAAGLLHAPRPARRLVLVFLPQICFISLGA